MARSSPVKVLICEVHHLAGLVGPLRLLGLLLGLRLGVGQEGLDGRLGVVARVGKLEDALGEVEEGGEVGHVVLPGHAGVLRLVHVMVVLQHIAVCGHLQLLSYLPVLLGDTVHGDASGQAPHLAARLHHHR